MANKAMSPNHREALTAISSITGFDEYIKSTNGAININGTIGGSPLPISGATTGVGVAILDGSGNQITSFGGGTQYTDGGTPPGSPIGPTLEFNNAGTWATVGTANPLPVSATISTAGLATSANQTNASQKTQLVDGSGNVIASTSNALNTSITNASVAVTGTFFQATQPISGTVTANAGTNLNTSALALAATQTDKSQFTKLTDGTDTALITAAGEQNVIATAQPGVDIGDVTINNASGASAVNIQDGGNSITVDGTVSITANSSVNIAQMNGVTTTMGNGVSGTGVQRVAIASDNTVLPGVGAGAIASAVPANATYKGLRAATSANPAAASQGNLVGAMGDAQGKQVVTGSIRALKSDAALTLTSTTTETTLIAATASIFNDLYGLVVTNISATGTEVIFRDVTAGTARFSIYVPAGDTRGFMLHESAGYKQATVNTAWTAQCVTSVASIKISALYVQNV